MILTVQLELPEKVVGAVIAAGNPTRIEILDSEVRDPARGVVGRAVGRARLDWHDGHRYLEITIDVDDQAAIDAATRSGPIF